MRHYLSHFSLSCFNRSNHFECIFNSDREWSELRIAKLIHSEEWKLFPTLFLLASLLKLKRSFDFSLLTFFVNLPYIYMHENTLVLCNELLSFFLLRIPLTCNRGSKFLLKMKAFLQRFIGILLFLSQYYSSLNMMKN